jgi:peptidyl-dipeptidase Dcp
MGRSSDAAPLNIFKKKDFSIKVATKFKENVFQGGTEHPMTLYKRFRGQEPKPDALLKEQDYCRF